jgi:F-type H+-transporting ATPase subunit epsilon
MAPFRLTFEYELLTPAGTAQAGKAVSVIVPAQDGQVGVLAGRAPLAAVIDAGVLTVERDTGRRDRFYVANGFAQVREGRMTVVAEECTPTGQLNAESAAMELARAQQPGIAGLDPPARAQLMRAAKLKLKLAQRKPRDQPATDRET